MGLNRVIYEGNLTRDVDKKEIEGGSIVSKTAIAVNRPRGNGKPDEVMFMDIAFFGRLAEVAAAYLSKGSKILVEGRTVQETWVDKTSGEKRSRHVTYVDNMSMLKTSEKNSHGGGDAGGTYHEKTPPAEPALSPSAAARSLYPEIPDEIPYDEIPI